jgi:hypothetical protein
MRLPAAGGTAATTATPLLLCDDGDRGDETNEKDKLLHGHFLQQVNRKGCARQ